MATQFVGDEGDNTLEGGPGENEFTGNAGNDVIDATEGVNTIYYNQGDGIDTVNFTVPREYQYADFLQAATDGLSELDGFSGSSYSNEYFGNADRNLVRDLPPEIADVLSQLHNTRSGESVNRSAVDGSAAIDACAQQSRRNWAVAPDRQAPCQQHHTVNCTMV